MSDEEDIKSESGDKRWITEMMREVTLTGLATFFMTEDSIRKYLKEKKLPKELVSMLLESASKKKDDFYGKMAGEFGKMLSKIDVTREVGKFLETHKVNISASVSFEPREKPDATKGEET